MTNRPQPKHEVAILWASEALRMIALNASPDALTDISEFGHVSTGAIYDTLFVDSRYDFDEVVAFIQNYGKEG